ncbi:amidohydrolase family protein [uncultured Desulfovibrio sp.]|uniref:amidohydrolase family protein n=1 Tax=uncultured Desulfovibrio sp. TaxID=167968 RepID=UPI0026113B56|nr:amidohydrolase family protein [uncultured Desulfovibrio sp.]
MKTVLQGGVVVRPDGVFAADISFENGRILEMGDRLPVDGAETVDASGCYVLPGAVDVLVHCLPERLEETGEAAARGGTTCHGWVAAADEGDVASVALPVDVVRLAPLTADAAGGTAPRLLGERRLEAAGAVVGELHAAASAGTVVLARPELPGVCRFLEDELRAAGSTAVRHWPAASPGYVEEEAARLAVSLARAAGCHLGLLPLSTHGALEAVRQARERRQPVWAATSPQYLLLDETAYEEGAAEGLKYAMRPPLRAAGQAARLWDALSDGLLDAVASDHHDTTFAAKWEAGSADAFACPAGIPGVETRLPLLFSEGVLKGRLTLPRLVQCLCSEPARVLGVGERKGDLLPGFDADICLLDPADERLLTARRLHQGDYTPFEGMSVRGWPRMVWLRGNRLPADGHEEETPARHGMWLSGGGD